MTWISQPYDEVTGFYQQASDQKLTYDHLIFQPNLLIMNYFAATNYVNGSELQNQGIDVEKSNYFLISPGSYAHNITTA